jgi:hypothetical protein
MGQSSSLDKLATALDIAWQASGLTVLKDVPINTIATPNIVAAVIPATAIREGSDRYILAATAMSAARARGSTTSTRAPTTSTEDRGGEDGASSSG